MDSVSAGNIVRDTLRTYLTDPYSTAGGDARDGSYWIFYNEPNIATKFPQIELNKIDNPSNPIEIGSNYMEDERLFLNIWFYSKNGFKVVVDGTTYINSQLVEYYLGQIKQTLKAQFNTMFNQCVKSYKHINTTRVEYDPDRQLYFGAVTIHVQYFNR